MNSSNDKTGSKVEVSAKAEAKLDVQAKVPEKSVGRLVDSLTDIIRPFSEARGLRADQIRLQREDVAIQIAAKARQRLSLEGVTPGPVPNKLMVPLLEAASIEDVCDSFMIETWANLLASASKKQNVHPRLVGILKELEGKQAQALEQIALNRFDNVEHPVALLVDGPVSNRNQNAEYLLKDFNYENRHRDTKISIEEFILETVDVPGNYIVLAAGNDGDSYFDTVGLNKETSRKIDEIDLEILKSLGVLSHKILDYSDDKNINFTIIYYYITDIGLKLLSACGRLNSEVENHLDYL